MQELSQFEEKKLDKLTFVRIGGRQTSLAIQSP